MLEGKSQLKPELSGYLAEAYRDAVLETVKQTPFEEADLPVECPFTLNQILITPFE